MKESQQIDDNNDYNNKIRQSNSNNEESVKRVHIPMPSQSELASFGAVYKSQFTLLDKIINDYGYGWEVNKIIFSAFLFFILNGYLKTSYCSLLGFKKNLI